MREIVRILSASAISQAITAPSNARSGRMQANINIYCDLNSISEIISHLSTRMSIVTCGL